MILHAVATTGGLILLSCATRIGTDFVTGNTALSRDLLDMALHWMNVANQDADPVLRFQHSAMAIASLAAARRGTRESDLERASSLDVSRLSRDMETQLRNARQALRASVSPSPNVESGVVSNVAA